MRTLYDVLECTIESTQEEIKKSYQRLALEFHPDKNIEQEKMDRFIEIDKAWKVLRDMKTRDLYNAQLKMDAASSNPLLYGTYTVDELIKNDEEKYFYCTCRCGGSYCINEEDLLDLEGEFFLECDQCSLTICVINKR